MTAELGHFALIVGMVVAPARENVPHSGKR